MTTAGQGTSERDVDAGQGCDAGQGLDTAQGLDAAQEPQTPRRAAEGLPALPLARSALDRAGERRGEALVAELLTNPTTRVLEVADGRAPVTGLDGHSPDGRSAGGRSAGGRSAGGRSAGGRSAGDDSPDGGSTCLALRAPVASDGDRLAVFLGRDLDGVDHLAVQLDGEPEVDEESTSWAGLRQVGALLDARDAGLMTQAVAVLAWHAVHPRCPRCGEPTLVVQAGWVRRCPADGSEHYPRTDPAVIMTVVDDDDRVLLGRGLSWAQNRFSTLAGFVEPGESLEAAVRREVMEEVGVQIGEVAYLGSQPWPFPASVMVGFRAHAVSTDVRVDGAEIAEARWFTRAELSAAIASGEIGLPNRLSIARALVEEWFGERLSDDGGTWR